MAPHQVVLQQGATEARFYGGMEFSRRGGLAWSPDEGHIYGIEAGVNSRLVDVSVKGGAAVALVSPSLDDHEVLTGRLATRADGSVLYIRVQKGEAELRSVTSDGRSDDSVAAIIDSELWNEDVAADDLAVPIAVNRVDDRIAYAIGPRVDPNHVVSDSWGLVTKAAGSTIVTHDGPDAGIVELSWAPDGSRLIAWTVAGDGRDLMVLADDGSLRSIDAGTIDELFTKASAERDSVNTIDAMPVTWISTRQLQLMVRGWSAGREPADLPPVVVTVDVLSGEVIE